MGLPSILAYIADYFRGGSGFLEMGFMCINVWGIALLTLSHFSKISHEK